MAGAEGAQPFSAEAPFLMGCGQVNGDQVIGQNGKCPNQLHAFLPASAQSTALVSISCFSRATSSSMVMLPMVSPLRVRTLTTFCSTSLSPSTSM